MFETKILPFEGNENAYRDFVLRHEELIYHNIIVPNSFQMVEWARGRKKIEDVSYGEFDDFPEAVVADFFDSKGFDCEFMPPIKLAVACGVSHEGQDGCYLRFFNDEDAKTFEVSSLMNGDLSF